MSNTQKSTRKPATFTLDNSTEARRFLAAVCDPLATEIIEQEGTLAMFDRVPDVGVYDAITAAPYVPSETDEDSTGYGLHCFHAGYLLGLAVGRKIGGGR